MKIYQRIAVLLAALKNCRKNGNSEWEGRHQDTLDQTLANGPSGAGIDCGTKLISSASTPERLVFYTEFHHMDEQGGYDGWTVHNVVVTPLPAIRIPRPHHGQGSKQDQGLPE